MAQRKGISTGTTAQRSIEEAGKLRFNTTTNLLEYYDGTQWKSIDSPPIISSIDVTEIDTTAGGNETFVITGSNFSTTITEVRFIPNSGDDIVASSVTRDSATQITAVAARSDFINANEPYDVKVTNNSGLAATLADQINVDSAPVWQTASGSIGTVYDSARTGISFTVLATDAESDAITYTLQSGSLPSGLSLTSTSSGAVISGDADSVGSNTTSTFTLRASSGVDKTSDRVYSITVNAPSVETFNSSGTFSVPSGLSSVNVLVVAGGGGGGKMHYPAGAYHHAGGGGGAGGLIYRPGFSVTPGGTITVTVGNGGSGGAGNYDSGCNPVNGQDSVFGTLTAKGGGKGTDGAASPDTYTYGSAASPGGSGGGGGQNGNAPGYSDNGGSAIQPTQPGDSGTYGFGNAGGGWPGPSAGVATAGGGGGAGAAGNPGTPASNGGPAGIGKAYSISGTSVYYAGGGGGGAGGNASGSAGQGGQGGGGIGGGTGAPTPCGTGVSGTANRGGGGGGGGGYNGATRLAPGGTGGKGIVIVSY